MSGLAIWLGVCCLVSMKPNKRHDICISSWMVNRRRQTQTSLCPQSVEQAKTDLLEAVAGTCNSGNLRWLPECSAPGVHQIK
mmetsp:Transcript_41751/g.87177  ORF Transcript_41751/g.87177 Transcript_41751/m.87177 type:complete len:82 (+) Transcript_41751:525-770(+)